jgi:hypothetical protein
MSRAHICWPNVPVSSTAASDAISITFKFNKQES